MRSFKGDEQLPNKSLFNKGSETMGGTMGAMGGSMGMGGNTGRRGTSRQKDRRVPATQAERTMQEQQSFDYDVSILRQQQQQQSFNYDVLRGIFFLIMTYFPTLFCF